MNLKNKIIAAALCALIAGIGIFETRANIAQAQSSNSLSGMSIAQLQQIVANLQQQIQQIIQLLSQRGQNVCIAEGQTFSDSSKQCCAGLEKITSATACLSGQPCASVNSYTCVKDTATQNNCPPTTAPRCIDGPNYKISYMDYNGAKCPVASCVNPSTICYTVGEGAIGTTSGTAIPCCFPLTAEPRTTCSGGLCSTQEGFICAKTTTVCGNGICEAGETAASCTTDCITTDAANNKCSVNADCVNDSGTCHQCFNKTWWTAQSASVKTQWICLGIGDALCKCQSGICAVASICGNGTCDTAKGETTANCAADCGGSTCITEGNKIGIYPGAAKCCSELTASSVFSTCVEPTYSNGLSIGSMPNNAVLLGTSICTKCGNGICGAGENKCNCPADCGGTVSCAAEGQKYSTVMAGYPAHCCQGLTEWASGFDSRIVQNGMCVETGLLKGSPIGTCLNCGDGICNSAAGENVCNCPKDCGTAAKCYTEGQGPTGLSTGTTITCCAGLTVKTKTSCSGSICLNQEGFVCSK